MEGVWRDETAFRVELISHAKGFGCVAAREIAPGTLIERVVALELTQDDVANNVLIHYVFNRKDGARMLPLGYGGLFNHAHKPNVSYELFRGFGGKKTFIEFTVMKHVGIGDELTISYGETQWDGAADSDSSDEDQVLPFMTRD